MFQSAARGETSKRVLAADDKDAAVFKYPTSQQNGYCDPVVALCGFCAPPNELTAIPTANIKGRSDGLKGCSCQATAGGFGWLLLLFAFGGRLRKKQA